MSNPCPRCIASAQPGDVLLASAQCSPARSMKMTKYFPPDYAIVLSCDIGRHVQDYRGRLPAAESWRRYQAGREADGDEQDGGLAWVDGATAALQNVRPDGVQSGERMDLTLILIEP